MNEYVLGAETAGDVGGYLEGDFVAGVGLGDGVDEKFLGDEGEVAHGWGLDDGGAGGWGGGSGGGNCGGGVWGGGGRGKCGGGCRFVCGEATGESESKNEVKKPIMMCFHNVARPDMDDEQVILYEWQGWVTDGIRVG